MSVNVMNGLHDKCQSVNQASFLECEPAEVFLHGYNYYITTHGSQEECTNDQLN